MMCIQCKEQYQPPHSELNVFDVYAFNCVSANVSVEGYSALGHTENEK